MLIFNCPYPGQNDMKGGEKFVSTKFTPAGAHPYALPILQTQEGQPPEMASEKARN